jgi:hypothetical protein
LDQLCNDALGLDERPVGGLMGSLFPQNQFGNQNEAVEALELHPIFRWLRSYLPRQPSLKEVTTFAGFRLVQLLVRYMTIAIQSSDDRASANARADKRRIAAWNALGRVQNYIADGTIAVSAPKTDMLAQLVAEAKSELMRPVPKAPKVPALQGLAHALFAQLNIADVRLLMDVADCLRDNCGVSVQLDKRTAERYIQKARRD